MTSDTRRVRIELYAHNLTNVANVFKGVSDPYAVVELVGNNDTNQETKVIGRTEV